MKQVYAGGPWSEGGPIVDPLSLTAGCYRIVAGSQTNIGDGTPLFNLTLNGGDEPIVLYPDDREDFTVGGEGVFCDQNSDFADCLANRDTAKPAMTCRNYITVLRGECGYAQNDAAYGYILSQCDGTPIFPISVALVFQPAMNQSAAAAFEMQLQTALGTLLDVYPDAFMNISVTHRDGFDVVQLNLEAYLPDEYNAVMALLTTDSSLAAVVNGVDALKGTTLEAASGVDGADQPIPSDVQAVIDELAAGKDQDGSDKDGADDDDGSSLVCSDGAVPAADGTCADGSTRTAAAVAATAV
ncbi:unnamed protein product [Phaeothamnion confervicola]